MTAGLLSFLPAIMPFCLPRLYSCLPPLPVRFLPACLFSLFASFLRASSSCQFVDACLLFLSASLHMPFPVNFTPACFLFLSASLPAFFLILSASFLHASSSCSLHHHSCLPHLPVSFFPTCLLFLLASFLPASSSCQLISYMPPLSVSFIFDFLYFM
jgi:hypothetical protein